MKTNVILIQKDSSRRLNVSTKRNWIEAIELHFCNNRQFCNNSITLEFFIRNRYLKLTQYYQAFNIAKVISFRKLFCTKLKGCMILTIWWKCQTYHNFIPWADDFLPFFDTCIGWVLLWTHPCALFVRISAIIRT